MTLASMMFMMPMPPTSSEIDAIATMTISKMRCVRRCSASSSAGNDHAEVAGAAVRDVEQSADQRRRAGDVGVGAQLQVHAVDLVLLRSSARPRGGGSAAWSGT